MGYANITGRAEVSALIPEDVSRDIIKSVPKINPLMQLARQLPNMSAAQVRMPMFGASPYAYFVSGDTGLKQTTEVDWTNKYIDAEEIAVILPIPLAVVDDVDYDIWGESKPEIEMAFSRTIWGAVAYGTNIPATWTTDLGGAGLVTVATAAGNVASIAGFSDLYEAIAGESADGAADGQLMRLEADGYMATGHVAATALRGRLRNCRSTDGVPLFTTAPQDATRYEIDGAPTYFPTDGSVSAAQALDIVGQWDQLVYAIRQDMTYQIFTEGVISDATGHIVLNLMQQDSAALRCVMRLGFAMPNPPNKMNETDATRCPFSLLTA
jgi:HK97 family phage major capsid protein